MPMTTRLVVSGRLVAEVVVLVRVDDVLLEVGPEPGEVVDLRGIAPDPLRILVHDGVVALVTIPHKQAHHNLHLYQRNRLFNGEGGGGQH